MRTALVDAPDRPRRAHRPKSRRTANGATLLFLGTVRDVNDGRAVIGMEYTAYRSMAERELAAIAREAAERSAPTTS